LPCTTPVVFPSHRFAAVIWANHMLRASLAAMQAVAARIAADQCLHGVEAEVAPLSEVFRLQQMNELHDAEARYTGPTLPLRQTACRRRPGMRVNEPFSHRVAWE